MRADTIQGKQNNLKTYVLKKKYQPSWLLFIQENCQSQLHSTQILFIYQNLNIIQDRYQDLGKLKSDFDTEHINIGFWINVFQFIQLFIVRIKITSYYLQYLLPPENAMIKAIDLAEFIKPEKIVYKTDSVLRNHNPKVGKNMSKVFNQDISETHGSNKMIVPIKQYSNKFLRQTAFKQNEKERTSAKQSRFTSIVNKHKVYQRKYQNVLARKHYICKTEPNQNEYQCFTTSNNFYKPHEHPEIEKVRVKTDCIVEKHSSGIDLNIFEKEEQKQLVNFTPAQQENVTSKNKTEFPRRDQKISTSRALQLFSKIISKDKGQLLDRMKSCNHKKLIKDKIMQSSKNLQAKQIVLLQKQKKCSFVEKGQNRISLKTGLKYGKKKSNVIKLFDQNQNFEICGWDIAN